jgi:hypothetical protein
VLAPTILRDFLADDTVRWGRQKGLPTIFLQMNFDNFNIKVPTARADYVAVWGNQSWYIARMLHRYTEEQLSQIGSARLEIYAKHRVDRATARERFQLPIDKRVILFCGATTVFDETRALKQIDEAIEDGRLSGDLIVLYKNHPKGLPVGTGEPFVPAEFKNVVPYDTLETGGWTDLAEYPYIFAAADAVMTPFSTMGIEAAMTGLPVMCVGYHVTRPNYWMYAQFIHQRIYYDTNWCVVCRHEEDYLDSVRQLIDKIGDPDIAAEARGAALSIARQDHRTFGERLSEVIDKVLKIERAGEPCAEIEHPQDRQYGS